MGIQKKNSNSNIIKNKPLLLRLLLGCLPYLAVEFYRRYKGKGGERKRKRKYIITVFSIYIKYIILFRVIFKRENGRTLIGSLIYTTSYVNDFRGSKRNHYQSFHRSRCCFCRVKMTDCLHVQELVFWLVF